MRIHLRLAAIAMGLLLVASPALAVIPGTITVKVPNPGLPSSISIPVKLPVVPLPTVGAHCNAALSASSSALLRFSNNPTGDLLDVVVKPGILLGQIYGILTEIYACAGLV